jgi:hypothetical protein
MNRGAGTGLMAFGIVLVTVGAIMRFATSVKTHGFDFQQAGVILLLVGIGVFAVSLLVLVLGRRSSTTVQTDVRETPGGRERTDQSTAWTA